MAVRIEGDELLKRKMRLLESRITSTKVKRFIGSFVVDMIYKRVKSGGGVSSANLPPAATGKVKLKPLSPKYKKVRQKKPLGAFASAARSNLTLTGQMLDALGFKVIGGAIWINVANTLRSDGLGNRQVHEWVSEDRPWLALTKTEYRILLNEVDKIVFREIKKLFT